MAISTSLALGFNDIGLGSGRVYRVGDNGVIVSGNQIAAFDDDGLVFSAVEFEPAPGGFGRITPFHVHDNQDGTMNVYFRLTGSSLPLTHRDVYVTLNAETGAVTGPLTDLPYAGVDGLGGMGHTNSSGQADGQMLQQAVSLSDGTIALIDTATTLNQFLFKIVNPDGTVVSQSASLGTMVSSYAQQLLFDMTEVGDKIAVAWTNSIGTGAPAHLRLLNKDGSFASAQIDLGNATSTVFGATPAVQVETLESGKFVIVWVESDTTSGPDQDQSSVWFSIRNADGSEAVAATLVNTEITLKRQDTPLLVATESGFVVGYSVLDLAGTQEGRLKEYDLTGALLDTETGAYAWGSDDIVRTDNNSAFVVGGNVTEIVLPGADTPLDPPVVNDDELLTGTAGADTLNGGVGDDTLVGLSGNDRLNGGTGADDLKGGLGADKLFGGDGSDTIDGGKGRDTVQMGRGNDLYNGHPQGTNAGRDTVYGGGGKDTIDGGGGNDVFYGNDGRDHIFGGTGNDRLFGGAQGDVMNGEKGADTLNGGAGNDKLTGGNGNDVFVFADGFGQDTIFGFNAADGEVIDLRNVTQITDFTDLVNNHLVDAGGFARIVDGTDTILLKGVSFADVGTGLAYSEADFLFA